MFIPTVTVDLVKAPIEIVRAIHEKDYGIQKGEILPQDEIQLLSLALKLIEALLPEVKKINKADAISALELIDPLLPEYFENSFALQEEIRNNKSESAVLLNSLIVKLNEIFSELIYIKNGRIIDESSEEYNSFFFDLMKSAIDTTDRVTGRTKLLALFD